MPRVIQYMNIIVQVLQKIVNNNTYLHHNLRTKPKKVHFCSAMYLFERNKCYLKLVIARSRIQLFG